MRAGLPGVLLGRQTDPARQNLIGEFVSDRLIKKRGMGVASESILQSDSTSRPNKQRRRSMVALDRLAPELVSLACFQEQCAREWLGPPRPAEEVGAKTRLRRVDETPSRILCELSKRLISLMSFAGAAHRFRKNVHFDLVQTAIRLRHRRHSDKRVLFDVGQRCFDDAGNLRIIGERQFEFGAVAGLDHINRTIDALDRAADASGRWILRMATPTSHPVLSVAWRRSTRCGLSAPA